MAFAHYLLAVPVETSKPHINTAIAAPVPSISSSLFSAAVSRSISLRLKPRKFSVFPKLLRIGHKAKAKPQESEVSPAADSFTQFKHLLLPITDGKPYLSEGTRQAASTATALAKKYGADITVVGMSDSSFSSVICLLQLLWRRSSRPSFIAKSQGVKNFMVLAVIDEKQKELLPEHDTKLTSIRWHLSEGGFQEFKLLERLGEGNKPTAIIGEIADEMNLDMVVMSMEAIHSKHVDANLLAEFIPCPVLLLPL
ncbi:hypothetical protein RJ639_007246 [Escallonia herrerae]|uniref:Universal stress protein n=1 Tax=Escallonia herrerae TaxID=1293975 RepID=A0AA88VVS6_9ASTE|nr:hypothetical protein RJ639_007246 [Escallonia herrerae]